MRSFKLFLTFISMIFILAGCVGTVEEKNPKASKTGKIDEEQITFSGIIDALPVSDSKVLLSWLPAAGNQADLVYLVYINGADIPIEVNGAGLNPDYSGALNFTVGGLTVNTTYSFSVGVLDTKTGTETDNNKSLFATTFANFTADFSGISALYPAAGEAGKSEVIVEWVPATTLGTQFSPRSTDPIAYEIRYIKATDGGPTNLRNQGDPNVTVLRNPTTLTSSTQLSNERLRRVVGLAPGTKYFFLVRAIHKSFVAFGTQPGYKLEENLKVLDVETVDDAGILDWDDSSIRVETVPGEGGLTKVDIKWADASGPFDHYRVYNIKVADSDETLADAEAAAPTFDATWYTDQNGLDEYEVVSAEDSFYRANNLESYAYYKTSVVVCSTSTCDQANRIPGAARIYRVTPDIAPFSGLLSINNPTALDEINQGAGSIDTVTVTFDSPVISAGFVNRMELYCFSSFSDTTPIKLETGTPSVTPKPGCNGITRVTPTPVSLAGIGGFTDIELEADFITGANSVSSRSYCFGVVPVIEDLASGYEVRDIENAVIKCKVFEIAVPKIDEFPGVKKFCSTSGETISVAWDPPIGGIYENYEIFYKESDGTGFKYADALAGEPGYTAIDGIATGATSYDITGLTPGKSYTYGILAYVDGSVKTYSEFNSGIQTCQVPYPSPRFKEWVDVFAVGPKVDGRVPLELQADSTGKPTTLFETFNRLGQPIEVEVDSNESPTTNHADQFGNIASSAIFDGVYGKPEQDVSSTELHQYSNSGIVRIAFKDITFDNNAFSMWDLITANGDDSELKKDRQFGYRIYRSADNGLTYQDLTASSNDFQTTSNSGLLHPIDFSEKPRINEAASTFKAVSFIDYSVKSLEQASNRERARIYLYKIVPVFDGVELPFSEQEELPQNVIRVILPPANMALVHRLVANRQMCMELGKSYLDDDGEADYENNYACEWNGIGAKGKTAPYVIGETVYDFGSDMLIDRYELGCNMTRGHQGNQDSIFVGDSDEFQGLADSGQVFKGCLQSTAASNQQNSGQATPWDSHSDWFKGDCVTQSRIQLNTGTTLCPDANRRNRDWYVLPGSHGIDTSIQNCEASTEWLATNYLDPYGSGPNGKWLSRVAQSEFMAVMHNDYSTLGDSRITEEYRGAGGELDTNKRIRVSGIDYRVSRCTINIPVSDQTDSGHQVPRWFAVNQLNNLTHDGTNLNLLDKTVGEIKGMVGTLFSAAGKEALPSINTSYNGRYDDNSPIAKVFSSNNSKLPPLQGININDANTICGEYEVEVGAQGEEDGDTFVLTEGRYNKRIMRRTEGIIANKQPEAFTETYANAIENGTAPTESPDSAGTNFDPSCNSYNRDAEGATPSRDAGDPMITRMPLAINGSGADRTEFFTGSSFYDPGGVNYSSQHCVSRYGVQDIVGNFVEFTSEKIFCEFDDEFLYYGQDGVIANSVSNTDVNLIGNLFDRDTVIPWVLSGTDTGRCSMVEDGSNRSYNPATGGTMLPLFDGLGNLNTDIVSTVTYNDPGFRSGYRNGDGYFMDFGQGRLGAPISVNDTMALRYSSYINGRRKEATGDPRESSFFNPITGLPLTCGGSSCTSSSTDNLSVSTNEFVTLKALDPTSINVPTFPIGNSNIINAGMSEITSATRYTLPRDAEGQVTYTSQIHPDGDGLQANPYRTTTTRDWDDPTPVILNRVYWDLTRNNAGASFLNFGGSNRPLGTGRYSLELINTDLSSQEAGSRRYGFRCVVRINETQY